MPVPVMLFPKREKRKEAEPMTGTRTRPASKSETKRGARRRGKAAAILLVLLLAAAVFAYGSRENLLPVYLRLRGCPESLISLLERNPETRDFVQHWPQHTDLRAAEPLNGEVRQGEIPLLLQWDERWGYTRYGSDFLAITGCGPTCLAMVCCGVTGREDVTPYTVARMAEDGGYYVPGVGTAWALMTEGAEHLGFEGARLSTGADSIRQALERGGVLICSMLPGDFTTEGHFIVLCGIDSAGRVTVRDPNSIVRSQRLWDLEVLAEQTAGVWSYTA